MTDSKKNQIQLLVIEDNEDDLLLYRRELQKDPIAKYIITIAGTVASGLASLSKKAFDCVLLDYSLPDKSGLEFLKNMQSNAIKHVPVVMFTGKGNFRLEKQALEMGAQDYLHKEEVTSAILCRSLRFAIERDRYQKERKIRVKLEKELQGLKFILDVSENPTPFHRDDVLQKYTKYIKDYIQFGTEKGPEIISEVAQYFYQRSIFGKEIIEIHLESIERLTRYLPRGKSTYYVEHGRYLLIGLLAKLTEYYCKGMK